MTDSEKLDLILQKLENHDQKFEQIDGQFKKINSDIKEIKGEIKDIKSEIKELHHMDTLILDEVERVHGIFAKKTEELQEKIG